MRLAIQSDFGPAGQMAFYQALQTAARRTPVPHTILPFSLPQEEFLRSPVLSEQIDAYAGSIVSDDWIPSALRRSKVWVDLAQWSSLRHLHSVGVDYFCIGQAGAQALLDHGCTTLALLAPTGQFRSLRLLAGMSAVSPKHPPLSAALIDRNRLRTWLAQLPSGTGILALSDKLARITVETLQLLEHAVGEDVRVIGIGDEPEASLLAGIEISSFPLPYEQMGSALIQLIEDRPQAAQRIEIPPLPLQERPSLTGHSPARDTVSQVLDWMAHHLRSAIGIEAVARAHGLSRRSLELRFRTAGRQSPNREWNRMRLDEVRRLLRQTDLPITEIAERCGYTSQARLTQAFSLAEGCPPSVWRNRLA